VSSARPKGINFVAEKPITKKNAATHPTETKGQLSANSSGCNKETPMRHQHSHIMPFPRLTAGGT
jgi:hypothetical protein